MDEPGKPKFCKEAEALRSNPEWQTRFQILEPGRHPATNTYYAVFGEGARPERLIVCSETGTGLKAAEWFHKKSDHPVAIAEIRSIGELFESIRIGVGGLLWIPVCGHCGGGIKRNSTCGDCGKSYLAGTGRSKSFASSRDYDEEDGLPVWARKHLVETGWQFAVPSSTA